MFLRRLTVRGFKSFADKTILEFTPGVSVIVGPNGSGKSNIADAIAWVLGEQGPRALRGGQMTDVIFAGSPARPAQGMAEVRLVIDNSGGLIPVPASEIEMSRAVLRSGESEYRLGGRPCRLLDIQEFLSDSGLGRALHTIVSQGHLEDVLSSRPEERRQFIEEAAGIAKHRRRRERAERKLAGLETDLNRLQDVVAELRRQLKPLRQQAELASKHEALAAEADDLARGIAAARLRDLLADRDLRAPAWERAGREQADSKVVLASLDAAITACEQRRDRTASMLAAAETLQASAFQARTKAEERVRLATREESRAREHLSNALGRSGRLFAVEEELGRTEAALDEVRGALASSERELEAAEAEFVRAERVRRDAEDERRRIAEETSTRRIEADALRRGLAGSEEEAERLAGTLDDVCARIDRLATRAGSLEAEVERLDAAAAPLSARLEELRRDRAALSSELTELRAKEKGLLARQEVVDARGRELEESRGAAFLARRAGRPLGLLRELLGVPAHLEPAVRAALGLFGDAVAYGRLEDALADAAAESASGVVLALASDGSAEEPAPASAGHVAPQGGGLSGERRLLDLIRPDPRVSGLAERILEGIYLVRNLPEAAAKHRLHPSSTFITMEGVVVAPTFVRPAQGHDDRVDRNRRDSAALERELAAVRRGVREGGQQLEELEREETDAAESLAESDLAITATAEEMASVESELASLRREEQLVSERVGAVLAAASGTRERLSALPPDGAATPPLPPQADPPMALRVDVEALRRDRHRLEAGIRYARSEIERLSAEDPVAVRRDVETCERTRVAAEEALRDAEGNLAGALAAHRAWSELDRRAQTEHVEANRAWRAQAGEMERLREAHEELDRVRADLDRRVAEAERLLREGHGADPSAAVGELGPDDTVDDLQRRADLVARRMGLLGKVNLLASGDLQPLQERHDFIVRELEDVKAARRDLLQLIGDVDRRMRELFEEAFRDVAAGFSELFAELFPGGEGRLVLTDPADPLASGVEIEARPGRKRVRRLSLLSGGERSMAALAFLFAIFRARPSPFYLLDEVEAALDDVNLHRFLEVVRTFAERSQLLIVSHQKRTMEIADVLYGVSMGPDGASAIISQRLAEVSAG